MSGNLYTLLKDPFPVESIPKYPTFKVLKAKGGEITHELVPATKETPLDVMERKAKKGELLRDVDLKYIASVDDNLKFRVERQFLCEQDANYRNMEMEYCASNILYFCNVYVWTHDPRADPGKRDNPFVTYPFQDDWLTWRVWCTKKHVDNLTEKSRDMGISWMQEVLHCWLALFYPGTTTYQLSMAEGDVDNRKVDSLFGKQRFILKHLPAWMRKGWQERNPLSDQKMMISFPDNESLIKGELTNTAGRGGRATVADFDEFAFVEKSESVAEACSGLAGSIGYNSTVNGMGNQFAKMAHRAGTHKKSLHWTLHPLKNEEWMIKEKADPKYADDSVWAQEQDIDYQKSKSGRVFPMFLSTPHDLTGWRHYNGDVWYDYDPRFPVYIGLDLGVNDPASAVFFQKREAPSEFKAYTEWTWVMFDQYETKKGEWSDKDWANYLKSRMENDGWYIEDIVMDPFHGFSKGMSLKTWYDSFKEEGLPAAFNKDYRTSPADTILNMKNILNKPGRFAIYLQKCGWAVESFQNWSFPIDKETGLISPKAKPKHDQYSHCMTAVLYLMDFCDNELLAQERREKRMRQQNIGAGKRWLFKA
jgi:hypothetical protein